MPTDGTSTRLASCLPGVVLGSFCSAGHAYPDTSEAAVPSALGLADPNGEPGLSPGIAKARKISEWQTSHAAGAALSPGPSPHTGDEWTSLAEKMVRLTPGLPPVCCGFSACIDRIYPATLVTEALSASDLTGSDEVLEQLLGIIANGRGGEIGIEWPTGPEFFESLEPEAILPGGTAVQAANQLALLGASPTLALERRSKELIGMLHPNVRLAEAEGSPGSHGVRAAIPVHPILEVRSSGHEHQQGRADRIILRLSNDPIERDRKFADLTTRPRSGFAAAVASGLNAVDSASFEDTLNWMRTVCLGWSRAGIPLRHFELAAYRHKYDALRSLEELSSGISSVGMNLDELSYHTESELDSHDEIAAAAERLLGRFGLSRVCVHSDKWAFSITTGDPERELLAIRFGGLLASTRARTGRPSVPSGIVPGATLEDAPWKLITELRSTGHLVASPVPYLDSPASTVGLGDTFLAGSIAVLAQPKL